MQKRHTDRKMYFRDLEITSKEFYISYLSDFTLSLQKNTMQSHKLQNDQGKTIIAKDSFVPLL